MCTGLETNPFITLRSTGGGEWPLVPPPSLRQGSLASFFNTCLLRHYTTSENIGSQHLHLTESGVIVVANFVVIYFHNTIEIILTIFNCFATNRKKNGVNQW